MRGSAMTDHEPRGVSRRQMFRHGATLATGVAAASVTRGASAAPSSGNAWAPTYSGRKTVGETRVWPPGMPGKDYTPVVVPGGAVLPFKIVDGVKVFHLVAEEVEHEFAPGLTAT